MLSCFFVTISIAITSIKSIHFASYLGSENPRIPQILGNKVHLTYLTEYGSHGKHRSHGIFLSHLFRAFRVFREKKTVRKKVRIYSVRATLFRMISLARKIASRIELQSAWFLPAMAYAVPWSGDVRTTGSPAV